MLKNLPKCVRTAVLSMVVVTLSAPLCHAEGIRALSKPSQDVTLMCARPGQIAKIDVQEGDKVKADQIIVQEDDRAEQIELTSDKAKGEDTTKVDAQKALLAQSKVDLDRVEWAAKRGAMNPFERDKARIDVVVSEAQLKVAEFDKSQADLKYQQTAVEVNKMAVRSPFDGVIAEKFVSPGESVELNTKVIRVVKLDPLWVEVDVPYTKARAIKNSSPATVTFTDKTTAVGKVLNVSPVANAAAKTIMVRLEVPNPEMRQSGEQVMVDFAEPKDTAVK